MPSSPAAGRLASALRPWPRTVEGHSAAPATAPPPAAAPGARLADVDALRGFAMVIMALDHVRDYFTAARFDPINPLVTTPAYFATRWITHLAAPIFVLLAGTAAYFAGMRRSKRELSLYLAKRGLFLIALEVTVIITAWHMAVPPPLLFLQVIWAIGCSLLALAGLVWLPHRAIAAVGVGMIALHNLLDPIPAATFGSAAWVWSMLHVAFDAYPLPGGLVAVFAYPIVPWIGVMAAGYALGPVFTWERTRRDAFLTRLGGGMLLLFLGLRASGLYGDPNPWAAGSDPVVAAMDFLDVTKYPPSLLFLCATLGPSLLALPHLDRLRPGALDVLAAYGRAPLFYYVVHLYFIHLLAVLAGVLSGYPAGAMLPVFLFFPPGYGWGLGVVYVVWIGVVLALLPATRWWGDLKRRRKDLRWLSYL